MMDDGAALWIDDRLVIDEWKQGASREVTVDLELKKGEHELKVEYYEASGTARVRFWWERKNEAPVAMDDEYSVDMEAELVIDAPGVLENDSDVDGDSLSVILVTNVANGSLTLNGNGSFAYKPQIGFMGIDGFEYCTTDGLEESNVAKVKIVVEPLNYIPEAVDDTVSTEEETPLVIDVLGNDLGLGDTPVALTITSQPENGIVEIIEDQIQYTPNEDFIGVDTFSYTVTDADDESSSAVVTITVIPKNIEP
ncbi:MAG: hypothetical protein A2Z14_17070 [Chloroflexi bacterium RBG_16_48_8]|nr:MAG: hypothetical protein A2Z14_17070 [Chloroflexi bacterium RBG_16_48_8]